jgi:Periplasmic binding protein/Bacterial regulatory proteins, tetR family
VGRAHRHAAKVPQICVCSIATIGDGQYNFTNIPLAADEAEAWVAEAKSRGLKTIAILAQQYPSIDGHVNALKAAAEGAGMKVVYEYRFPAGTTAFLSSMKAAGAKKPDVYFVSADEPSLTDLGKQILAPTESSRAAADGGIRVPCHLAPLSLDGQFSSVLDIMSRNRGGCIRQAVASNDQAPTRHPELNGLICFEEKNDDGGTRPAQSAHQTVAAKRSDRIDVRKDYRAITVQDIIDRADVGRSTFYSHYTRKDELLRDNFAPLRSIIERPAPSEPTRRRLMRFSLPLFRHVSEQQRLARPAGQRWGPSDAAPG